MAQTPPHHFKASMSDGVLVITITEPQLRGDALAETLRQELLDTVAHVSANSVVIDLGQVVHLSSAAFRPLLSLRRRLQETGGRMVLCALSPPVLEIFRLLRLISTSRSYSSTFDVEADVPAAVKFLKQNPS